MNLIAEKTNTLQGIALVPPSKSHSVRALLIAAMAEGQSTIHDLLDADDSHAALEAIRLLGAGVEVKKNEARGTLDAGINSPGIHAYGGGGAFHTHDSGITTRFLLPMLGLGKGSQNTSILDCGPQMRERPIRPLVEALRALGMTIKEGDSKEGYPLTISGTLRGGRAQVPGLTSQYISALLLSLPLAENDSEITVVDLRERPYVAMTTDWLRRQGITYDWQSQPGRDIFRISGRQNYRPLDLSVPGDFSSASCIIAAGAIIPGEVRVQGLTQDDSQGDKRLIDLVKEMGGMIRWDGDTVLVQGGQPLRGINIDCADIPDLLPALAVLGTYAGGETRLRNVAQARIKETDRIKSMGTGLQVLGASVEELADGLVVRQSKLRGAVVDGCGDHRTVMALALAGLCAEGQTVVSSGEAVGKTFPGYVGLMQDLGGRIRIAG